MLLSIFVAVLYVDLLAPISLYVLEADPSYTSSLNVILMSYI